MFLDANRQVRVLLTQECLNIKQLAELLTKKTGKKYYTSGLSRKFNEGTLRYDEVLTIAKLLGYKIEFIKENSPQ